MEIKEALSIIENEENRTKRDIKIIRQAKEEFEKMKANQERSFEIIENQNKEIERLNSIINNIDKKCKYLLENEEVMINEKIYYKQKCDDIITNFIYEELKGSAKA